MGKKRGWDHTRRKELAVRDASESSDEDEGEREEEHQMEAAALASSSGAGAGRAVRQAPYNRAGLLQRLADISDDSLDWVENLDCCE